MIVKIIGSLGKKDDIDYLKYNGYGKMIVSIKKDIYLCLLPTRKYQDMGDVKVLAESRMLMMNYVSKNEVEYKMFS